MSYDPYDDPPKRRVVVGFGGHDWDHEEMEHESFPHEVQDCQDDTDMGDGCHIED